MLDIISIISIFILTVLSLAYTSGCDRLKGARS
jgi:hypothetical protein